MRASLPTLSVQQLKKMASEALLAEGYKVEKHAADSEAGKEKVLERQLAKSGRTAATCSVAAILTIRTKLFVTKSKAKVSG